ncbi:MAG: acetate--CoA ligase [Candidatus Bipolaricaulota bacterium]|nr:acetate--CoA ligase [Candidatus Bipolaricaulota bacterium]MCX7843848.1 acetate--CoA ligase [Candidatus Bipolaricaulota bacterium]MDW8151430.1 acetate--CoA ligase [Candidatus Bipolaricaulota bacterium]
MRWVQPDPKKENWYWPTEAMKARAWVSDPKIYEEAAADPVAFWAKRAEEIVWFQKWSETYVDEPYAHKWFVGGKLNLSYNSLDRHVEAGKGNKVALIWEPEPPHEPNRILTYKDLLAEVSRLANALKRLGIRKGDRIGIYLPMIPEAVIAMQACVRIGAVHTVVFSAFSAESLRDRLLDSGARLLITADGYYRRGKLIDLKPQADQALTGTKVERVIVVRRTGHAVPMDPKRDIWYHELVQGEKDFCPAEPLDSEDLAFILYTSGTTGKPKGVMHTTGGYAVQVYTTAKWDFNLHEDDVHFCTADVGWITGHSYVNYGPLMNGVATVVYEGSPDYPDFGRMWQIVEKHKVTVYYTAPTAIRMHVKWGDEWPKKYDLTTLRVLGTVGEPINEEAWLWYFKLIGGERCPIIDTWWQTETGATCVQALPGIGPFIPTVAGRPFPGIRAKIVDAGGAPVKPGEGGYLVLEPPFPPALTRGLYGDPEKFRATYFGEFGPRLYFTKDGARMDEMGNIRITGRVDDVMNVAGHRLATAEVEDALSQHPLVSEVAVVSRPDEIKGEVPVAFVLLKAGAQPSEDLKKELIKTVDKYIGPTARPAEIYFVEDVPKTRSGKIMRRILKALVRGEPVGDITTLRNPECVEDLKRVVGYKG